MAALPPIDNAVVAKELLTSLVDRLEVLSETHGEDEYYIWVLNRTLKSLRKMYAVCQRAELEIAGHTATLTDPAA